jgi:hypothetical protein
MVDEAMSVFLAGTVTSFIIGAMSHVSLMRPPSTRRLVNRCPPSPRAVTCKAHIHACMLAYKAYAGPAAL